VAKKRAVGRYPKAFRKMAVAGIGFVGAPLLLFVLLQQLYCCPHAGHVLVTTALPELFFFSMFQ
jgi:hypothetical protein